MTLPKQKKPIKMKDNCQEVSSFEFLITVNEKTPYPRRPARLPLATDFTHEVGIEVQLRD